jgi:hypothetical protein
LLRHPKKRLDNYNDHMSVAAKWGYHPNWRGAKAGAKAGEGHEESEEDEDEDEDDE